MFILMRIISLFSGAAKQVLTNVTEKEVEDRIGRILRGAKDREGGRKRRSAVNVANVKCTSQNECDIGSFSSE